MQAHTYPRIGIGVLIKNDNDEVLIGLRKGSHGAGEWSFPGGHLEFGETIFDTAIRETKEETGLAVSKCELISVSDDFRYIESDGKHYVTIGVLATYEGGTPTVREPESSEQWKWCSLDQLPENILEGTQNIIYQYKRKTIYTPQVINT